MLLKLGFKNILRNKRRTFLTGLAIGIGMSSLIITDGLILGMRESMIKSATNQFLGHAQIHRKGFRDTIDTKKTINNLTSITNLLNNDLLVKHYSVRTQSFAMISSPRESSNCLLFGINPSQEQHISQLKQALIQGNFLEEKGGILLGSKIVKKLKVKLGEKIVVTTSDAMTGELSQTMLRVTGIFAFNIDELDNGMAFINITKAQKLLGLQNDVHEIAIKFNKLETASNLKLPQWEKYRSNDNELLSWNNIMPQIEVALEMSDYSTATLAIILFALVFLGIMNTLFMSLYERMFEFGVLRAIGTRDYKIIVLVLYESGSLALISIILGIIITFLWGPYLATYGIDYSGIEFAGVTFQEPIKIEFRLYQFIVYPLVIFIFTLVAGIYPSIYASKITLANAIKKSL